MVFTYPLDVVRARLAFQVKGEHIYLGLIHTVRSIVHVEGGTKALYRGLVPSILGMAPYAGKNIGIKNLVLFLKLFKQSNFYFC